MTNLQNPQDLAPNYAGSLYGIINGIGITSGFITPLIVSYFTAEQVKVILCVLRGKQFCIIFRLILGRRARLRSGNGYLWLVLYSI